MRSISCMLIVATVLCARVAFAADRAAVDMPFSFETHGKVFPAGQYDVTLKGDRSTLTLASRTNRADTISWTALFSGMGPSDAALSIQFDRVGTMHELHAIRLGEYQTPLLDTHLALLKDLSPAQAGQ
jgi:hypothetical protein